MHSGTYLQCCSDVRVSQFVQVDPWQTGFVLRSVQASQKRARVDYR